MHELLKLLASALLPLIVGDVLTALTNVGLEVDLIIGFHGSNLGIGLPT